MKLAYNQHDATVPIGKANAYGPAVRQLPVRCIHQELKGGGSNISA